MFCLSGTSVCGGEIHFMPCSGCVLWWFLTLMFYGVHNHQATLGRERAKMEFKTSKFDPKSSKSFQKKNYAHWQETVFADVILLLFSVVEYAKNKHHPVHSSWQARNFSGLLRRLKLALSVQTNATTSTSVCRLLCGVTYKLFRKY